MALSVFLSGCYSEKKITVVPPTPTIVVTKREGVSGEFWFECETTSTPRGSVLHIRNKPNKNAETKGGNYVFEVYCNNTYTTMCFAQQLYLEIKNSSMLGSVALEESDGISTLRFGFITSPIKILFGCGNGKGVSTY
jgi:hypothetical protein